MKVAFGIRFSEADLVKPFAEKEWLKQGVALGPNGDIGLHKAIQTSDFPPAQNILDRGIFLVGRIEYIDALNTRQWTNFRMRYSVSKADGKSGLTPTHEGNDAS